MSKLAIRMMMVAAVSLALAVPSFSPVYAAGSDEPSPPPSSSTKSAPKGKKKKSNNQSRIDDPAFLNGYRAA
jgi:hypothetical protein